MARRDRRPEPTQSRALRPLMTQCPACGHALRVAYTHHRDVTTLAGPVRLNLTTCHCANAACLLFRRPYHPEEAGRIVLPQMEVGLDVLVLVGALHNLSCRVPQLHEELTRPVDQGGYGLALSERTVTYLVKRYKKLVTAQPNYRQLRAQGRVILAIDGVRANNHTLWLARDCLSGDILQTSQFTGAETSVLAMFCREVHERVEKSGVRLVGVLCEDRPTMREAVRAVFPAVPTRTYHPWQPVPPERRPSAETVRPDGRTDRRRRDLIAAARGRPAREPADRVLATLWGRGLPPARIAALVALSEAEVCARLADAPPVRRSSFRDPSASQEEILRLYFGGKLNWGEILLALRSVPDEIARLAAGIGLEVDLPALQAEWHARRAARQGTRREEGRMPL